ncbi:hypothetical protein EGW08_019912 [Elysia chlorotica]|uniref:5' exonuclease Apollo n=1 Tax=Elysia chlorotica TaxID=188477 RepID=A0A3S0ZPM8_ELYCH|nr:hypothetical protein EGW08_019912 [Elysia chlorotica]
MNGHILQGTNIAVDYWKIKGIPDSYIHFLTHVHGDHIVGLTSSWGRQIYCSDITAMLLVKRHGISKTLLNILPIGERVIVSGSESFTVMAFDANHCPGAVMLYFQGKFGNIFYCGDFRSSADLISDCSSLAKYADILYLDNTFCDKKCIFPSRNECLAQILSIIRQHPEQKILIAVRNLGKETLLGEIGAQLNETIVVPPTIYNLCCVLFETNVFTTSYDIKESRIWAVPMQINYRSVADLRKIDGDIIFIVPTAMYTGLKNPPMSSLPGVFVVPYSDHSNYIELQEFVTAMKPKCIKPIVERPGSLCGESLICRADMSCFHSLLSSPSFHNHQNPSIEEERGDLLINQLTSDDHESNDKGINDDCVCLNSKRVFKIVDQYNDTRNRIPSASVVSNTMARLKLNSILKSRRSRTAGHQHKKKQHSHRKKLRSKTLGVVYIDRDETSEGYCLPSNNTDLSVIQQEVSHEQFSSQKLDLDVDFRRSSDIDKDNILVTTNNKFFSVISEHKTKSHEQVFQNNPNVQPEQTFSPEENQCKKKIDSLSSSKECMEQEMAQVREKSKELIDLETQGVVSVLGACSAKKELEVTSVAPQEHNSSKNRDQQFGAGKLKIYEDSASHSLDLEHILCNEDISHNFGTSSFSVSEEQNHVWRTCEGTGHAVLRKEPEATAATIYSTADCSTTNGHVLPDSDIAVDYWKNSNSQNMYVHFFTNVHGNNIAGLTSSWQRPIYCSEITAVLLEKCYHISRRQLKVLPLCEKVTLKSKSGPFTVMAFDANHCPGAIMLHFQGSFGSIFYTGNFRCSADVIAKCCSFAKFADILYIDNTFCDQECTLPTRRDSLSHILDIIHQHPKHKIIIGVHKLGKECLLGELGTQLNETIVVPTMFYNIYCALFDTNVFTSPQSINKSRIYAVPLNISRQEVAKLRKIDKNVIVIIPTAENSESKDEAFMELPNVYVIPFSNHPSYPELLDFVSAMRPKCVKPITKSFDKCGLGLDHRVDMSCFEAYLSSPDCLHASQSISVKGEDNQSKVLLTDQPRVTGNIYEPPMSALQLHSERPFCEQDYVAENILLLEKKNGKDEYNFHKKMKSTHISVVSGEIRQGTVQEQGETMKSRREDIYKSARNDCLIQMMRIDCETLTKDVHIVPGPVRREVPKKCLISIRKDPYVVKQCDQNRDMSLSTANNSCSAKKANNLGNGSPRFLDQSSNRNIKVPVRSLKTVKDAIHLTSSYNKSPKVCEDKTTVKCTSDPEHGVSTPSSHSYFGNVPSPVSNEYDFSRQSKSSLKKTISSSSKPRLASSNTYSEQPSDSITRKRLGEQVLCPGQGSKTFVKSLQAFIAKKRKLS